MRTTLRENETVIFETKKHWIILLRPFVFLIASVVLHYYFQNYRGSSIDVIISWLINPIKQYSIFLIPVFMLYFLYSFIERIYNLWAVTNYRVIDECGVFISYVKESPLDKINNITWSQSMAGTMLGYGSVSIQTAAEQGLTVFDFVSSPKTLTENIVSAQGLNQNGKDSKFLKDSSATSNNAETKICPYCAETIKSQAKLCRFCGKTVEDMPKTADKKIIQPAKIKDVDVEIQPTQTNMKPVIPKSMEVEPQADYPYGKSGEKSKDFNSQYKNEDIKESYNPRAFLKGA